METCDKDDVAGRTQYKIWMAETNSYKIEKQINLTTFPLWISDAGPKTFVNTRGACQADDGVLKIFQDSPVQAVALLGPGIIPAADKPSIKTGVWAEADPFEIPTLTELAQQCKLMREPMMDDMMRTLPKRHSGEAPAARSLKLYIPKKEGGIVEVGELKPNTVLGPLKRVVPQFSAAGMWMISASFDPPPGICVGVPPGDDVWIDLTHGEYFTCTFCDAAPPHVDASPVQAEAKVKDEQASEEEEEAEKVSQISLEEASLPGSDVPSQYSRTSFGHVSEKGSGVQASASAEGGSGWAFLDPFEPEVHSMPAGIANLSVSRPSAAKKARHWDDISDSHPDDAPELWPTPAEIENRSAASGAKPLTEVKSEKEAEGFGSIVEDHQASKGYTEEARQVRAEMRADILKIKEQATTEQQRDEDMPQRVADSMLEQAGRAGKQRGRLGNMGSNH